jgi:predicted DNA-binding transcriptional regulator YafY
MNRLDRMTAILLLLQQRAHTAGQLAGSFEVSRRTVLRDIQALCEIGVPIIAREGVGGGYSLPEGYSLAPLPLTTGETFLLLFVLSSLERLPDLPFAVERASLAAKVHALLERQLPAAEPLLAALARHEAPHVPRAPALPALLEAIRAGSWLRILYQSAERRTTQHILPRSVMEQGGYWYCQAYAHERGEERTYRVDRMLELGAPGPEFTPPAPGAGRPYDDESHPEIQAELTPRGVAVVETEPHLGAQLQRLPEGGGRLCFRCPPGELAWYERYFASLGLEVQVHAPTELRERLRKLGAALLERYGEW